MKHFLAFFMFFTANVYGQVSNCQSAADDVRLFCEDAKISCDDIKDCLIRRDTCVNGVPQNEAECLQLGQCMKDNVSGFSEHTLCEYLWATPDTGESFCRVKKHFFLDEQSCPGRITGIGSAILRGISTAVDKDFNCKAVVAFYKKKEEICNERIQKASSACGGEAKIPSAARRFKGFTCEYERNFNTYQAGQFALTNNPSDRIIDSSRSIYAQPPASNSGQNPSNSSAR